MISKNTVIGFLVFSAVVLACVLVLQVAIVPRTAQASITTQSNGYAITTALIDNDTDLLWMLNTKNNKLTVYQFDRKGEIIPLAQMDIKDAFEREEEVQDKRLGPNRR